MSYQKKVETLECLLFLNNKQNTSTKGCEYANVQKQWVGSNNKYEIYLEMYLEHLLIMDKIDAHEKW